MSVSGHVTLAEAQRYCETFGRKALSDSAFSKLQSTKSEQNLTNYPVKFVRSGVKVLKIKETSLAKSGNPDSIKLPLVIKVSKLPFTLPFSTFTSGKDSSERKASCMDITCRFFLFRL